MYESIGFIGAGRIARIVLGGWRRAGKLPARVAVHDPGAQALGKLREAVPEIEAATLADAARADLVFGALHPPALLEALPAIASSLRSSATFCSLAPRIRLSALGEKLPGVVRLARQNPNAPSVVGAGYNPIAFDARFPVEERATLLGLLAPLGRTPVVEEATLEAYAVISAMGPTYLWFQLQTLRELAREFGLSAEAADEAVGAMVGGASATLLASGLPPPEVMDLVPTRPMAEDEATIRAALQVRLRAIHAKLRG